jgi:hypothetical protein
MTNSEHSQRTTNKESTEIGELGTKLSNFMGDSENLPEGLP